MKNPRAVAGRDMLLAVVLLLLAPLAAVVATTAPAHAGPTFQQPAVGECRWLTIEELNRNSNNEAPIDCSRAHSSRVIATGRLPKGVTWRASAQRLERIATGICDPAWKTVLGKSYASRAMTAYSWAWFIPTKAQRDRGARWIRCDLILMGGGSRAVGLPTDDEPALGSQPHPNGIADCLTRRTFVHTICARTHAWRATGTFVIDQKAYPTERQFRRAAVRRCPSRVSSDSFAWRFRGPDRWRLGDHVVVCFSRTGN